LLRKVLEAAKRLGPDRWGSLTPLVQRLAELGHWREARDVAQQTEQGVWKARMLAGIDPHLPEDERLAVLSEAWEAAATGWRNDLLRELKLPLPEGFVREKLKEVLAESTSDQAHILASLAPRLAEAGCYQEALEALEGLDRADKRTYSGWGYDTNRAERIKTLVAVAVHLPEPLRAQKLEEALHAGQQIGDAGACNLAIKGLDRHLPEPSLRDALEARDDGPMLVAAALDGSLSEAPLPEPLQNKALDAARAIPESYPQSFFVGGKTWTEHSPRRAQALAALVPRLSEPLRSEALEEAQDAVQRIKTAFEQVKILASIARYLPDLPSVTDERLQEALSQARGGRDGEERENRLAALGPYRPEPSPREAEEALSRDEDRRRRVQTSIAALREQTRPEDIISLIWARDRARLERQAIFNHALNIAREIANADERAEAFTELVPYLDEMLRPVVLESDQFTARDLDQVMVRESNAMHALAPYLPESALPKVIEAVKAIGEPDEREEALRALISRRSPMSLAADRRLWSEALRVFAARTRQKLLANLSALLPMLDTLAEAEARDETASAIRDVARWYP